MKTARGFFAALRTLTRARIASTAEPGGSPKIGLALGGGFARGIAHAGVLDVFERNRIPIHCITGVSAGSIVAAAYASGASPAEIARAGCAMRFGDVARWSLGRTGFVVSERMKRFLEKLLKNYRFEEMRIPLGVLATDLCTGESVNFRDKGDVFLPIRASCSYPGLFQPLRYQGRVLVDGAMSMEIPALAGARPWSHARDLGTPAGHRRRRVAEQSVSSGKPVLSDHAVPQRGRLAQAKRSGHCAGRSQHDLGCLRLRTGTDSAGRNGGGSGASEDPGPGCMLRRRCCRAASACLRQVQIPA